jgi:hypothetical protein
MILPLFLYGGAFMVYNTMDDEVKKDYKKLRQSPCQTFTMSASRAYGMFKNRCFEGNESVDVYYGYIRHLSRHTAIREGMPSVYKKSMIAPLLKKKKDSEANVLANYRPISNLPFLSKVIERAVFEQIFHYLDGNNLLDPRQSAYRPHHSCETTLLVLNHALVGIDEHKVTLLVLIDLSSAFDCVDHKIRSTRLQQLGIIGDAH